MTTTDAYPATVEHWAQVTPHSTAIMDDRSTMSWAEWNAGADRVAHSLAERGLRAGDVIAMRTQIRAEWCIVAWAAAKLDCRILLMNWRLTSAEVARTLESAAAAALVCDDADPAALAGAFEYPAFKLAVSIYAPAPGFVTYDELLDGNGGIRRFAARPPQMIVFTSGTTGAPKGIEVNRGSDADAAAIAEYQASVAAARPQRRGDIMLLTMPLSHGAGPGIVWGAVRLGNLVVMQKRFDAEATLALIQLHKVTMWNAVPTMYKRLAALPADVLEKYDTRSLRSLSVSAAPISAELKRWVLDTFGECLSESYGASETGVLTTLTKENQRRKLGSSGYPHARVELSIRDAVGAVQPIGTAGEIWARTPIVIRTYLDGQPIGPDTLDANGFFRTGDVGFLDADGFLFITDRVKDMIVSGGVNIYPAEIEAVIATHPAVQEAAVIGLPDEEFGERVAAVCELKPGMSCDETAILDHCRKELASYKLPRSVSFVAELPRNAMGKLLKRDLRDPHWQGRPRTV